MILKTGMKINIEDLRRETKRWFDNTTLAKTHGVTHAGQEYYYSVEKNEIIEIIGEDLKTSKVNKLVKRKKK